MRKGLSQTLAAGLTLIAAAFTYAQTSTDKIADLSAVRQLHETDAQRDARMSWFCDAKFGMFIHWKPMAERCRRSKGWKNRCKS